MGGAKVDWPEFLKVKQGDLLCNKGSGDGYLAAGLVHGSIILIRVVVASNPDEWEKVDGSGTRSG